MINRFFRLIILMGACISFAHAQETFAQVAEDKEFLKAIEDFLCLRCITISESTLYKYSPTLQDVVASVQKAFFYSFQDNSQKLSVIWGFTQKMEEYMTNPTIIAYETELRKHMAQDYPAPIKISVSIRGIINTFASGMCGIASLKAPDFPFAYHPWVPEDDMES